MTIFYNDEFLRHMQGPFHPESPERLRGIAQKLKEHGLWTDVASSKSKGIENLRLVHDSEYIDFIKTCGECLLTLDTIVHNETYDIAVLSAECAVDAALHSKKAGTPTFALTRPPGHHSGRDFGMGFCYFNNISIAARKLLREGDKRVAIVDIDVHHGNGSEGLFADDPTVLYLSMHQNGTFPGTGHAEFVGKGEGEGFTVNLPIQSGCGDSTFDVAHMDLIGPLLKQFRPDHILVSWGMDTHYRDPLASLTLSSAGQVREALDLVKLASMCGNRITFMLEGGYDVPALAEVVACTIGATRGKDVPLLYTDVIDNSCQGRAAIECTRKILSEYWSL